MAVNALHKIAPALAAMILSTIAAVVVSKPVVEERVEKASPSSPREAEKPLPTTLAETGLYESATSFVLAKGNRPFTPQYPLWSDGAKKARFIHLPEGQTIDATNPDAWDFPVGTKLWKELSFDGRRIETRYIERAPSGWRFAVYVWNEDNTSATLVTRGAPASANVAPGLPHQIPSQSDCRVCHGNGPTPVLGFSALQLSTDRDANALHREQEEPALDGARAPLDLRALYEGGWLRGGNGDLAPRIDARSATERSVLGYLHANCGGCHRDDGPLASIGLVLSARAASPGSRPGALASTVDVPSHLIPSRMRVARREPAKSLLLDRMSSRSPATQMPPLGTQLVDHDATNLVEQWISELPN